jgi:antitoxin component HigA of HigAB toxin-antitoxin module
MATFTYTAPLTSTQTAAAVWDETAASHVTAGSMGAKEANLDAAITTRATPAQILQTPTNPIKTNASNQVEASSVQGNVTGSVASVTAGVTVSTNNDKTGYALSAAGVQAIWDSLTSALTTVGSIGKRISDNLDALISSRMATFTYTAPPTVAAIRTEMDTNSTKLANLDATVSSRLATSGYTAPLTATSTANAVWNEVQSGHTTAGTFGKFLDAAVSGVSTGGVSAGAIAAAVWDEVISGHTTAGTTGKRLGDNLDVAVSSRLASGAVDILQSAADKVWSTTARALTDKAGFSLTSGEHTNVASDVVTGLTAQGYTSSRAGKLDFLDAAISGVAGSVWNTLTSALSTVNSIGKRLADNVDAAVSSRMATFSYTAPPTVTAIRQEIDANSTKLDAAISSRLATAGYTTPPTVAAIRADLDANSTKLANLDATVSSRLAASAYSPGGSGTVDNAAIAAAVWNEAIASHTTAGTTGQALSAAGGAADPLLNAVPGSYAAGTAGAALGKIGAASITVVNPVSLTGNITIVQSDDYYAADNRAVQFVNAAGNWANLTSATVKLYLYSPQGQEMFSVAGTVPVATGINQTVRFEIPKAKLIGVTPAGNYKHKVIATLSNGHTVTLLSGLTIIQG